MHSFVIEWKSRDGKSEWENQTAALHQCGCPLTGAREIEAVLKGSPSIATMIFPSRFLRT